MTPGRHWRAPQPVRRASDTPGSFFHMFGTELFGDWILRGSVGRTSA